MPVTWSPEQWLVYLQNGLDARLPMLQTYENYYRGQHPMAFATAKFKEAFGSLLETFSDNWCGLIVDAAVERLQVQGFRFGGSQADDDAWAMWQVNQLDAESIKLHTESVKLGIAYTLVDPLAPIGAVPRITVEHPSQVIVAHDKGDPSRRLAALKRYTDIDGTTRATVYLPDSIHRYVARIGGDAMSPQQTPLGIWVPGSLSSTLVAGRWELDEQRANNLGAVPVVPVLNNPGMMDLNGVSDLRPALRLNDAANKFFMDMMVTSEYAAFPQRVLLGVDPPEDPVTHEPMPPDLVASASRTWFLTGGDGGNPSATQFQAADLSNFVNAMDLVMQHMSAQTRTPAHYLLAKLVNIGADALKAAETGLIFRCKRKHIDYADAHEETMRLSFRGIGDRQRGAYSRAETIWASPETINPMVEAQAATQRRAVGVPLEVLWEELGYSPTQISRMVSLAGLPDRPPPGATTAQTPSPGQSQPTAPAIGQVPATP